MHRATPMLLMCLLCFPLAPYAALPDWVAACSNIPNPDSIRAGDHLLILFQETELTYNSEGGATEINRVAFRPLTNAGTDDCAFSGPVNSFAKTKRVRGWKVRDGDVEKLDRDESAYLSADLWSAKAITGNGFQYGHFDDIKPGDLVCYEASTKHKPWTISWQKRHLLQDVPACSTRFRINWKQPIDLEFSGDLLESYSYSDGSTWAEWTAGMQWPRESTPYSRYNSTPLLVFRVIGGRSGAEQNWSQVVHWIRDTHDDMFQPDDSVKELALQLTSGLDSWEEKVHALCNHVRRNIRYVNVAYGMQGWIPLPAAETHALGYGDCKNKANLVRSLLAATGINSEQVLVHTDVTPLDDLPGLFQFNHAIVAIECPEELLPAYKGHAQSGTWILFDPTDEGLPFGQAPAYLADNDILICADGESGLTHINPAGPDEIREELLISGHVSAIGEASCTLDYRAPLNRQTLPMKLVQGKPGKDWLLRLQKQLAGPWSFADVELLEWEVLPAGLHCKVQISGFGLVLPYGSKRFSLNPVPFSLLPEAEVYHKMVSSDMPQRNISVEYSWELADNWSFDQAGIDWESTLDGVTLSMRTLELEETIRKERIEVRCSAISEDLSEQESDILGRALNTVEYHTISLGGE